MVEVTLRTRVGARRLTRASSRVLSGWGSAVADLAALAGAYLGASVLHGVVLSTAGTSQAGIASEWSILIPVVALASVFYVSGLYELEAYVSRPLHLWMILKASLFALAISAISVYAIKADAFGQSRFVLLATFGLFLLFACVLRLVVFDSAFVVWMRQRGHVTFVLGESAAAQALADRLGQLRGFEQVEMVASKEFASGTVEAFGSLLARRWSAEARSASVFIDGSSERPRDVFNAAAAAQAMGADVYMVSGLLQALEGNRLLTKLFGAPVTRLRGSIETAKPYPLKRAFDIVGSAALLLLVAPVIAVLGIVIRMTSAGPVFYRQTRVGRSGAPFEFLKLRSMVMDGDECIHVDYVRAFMNGSAEAVATGTRGEAIFKKVDDPRITPVGRFVRKYSLDELPQFWNVLRGDMSLVGPRPPLLYEVSEYDDWDSLRLSVPAGITGLWQVEGRSRVSFDEMILQDLMYAQNMRLLVDLGLCLRTLPATLLGSGGG